MLVETYILCDSWTPLKVVRYVRGRDGVGLGIVRGPNWESRLFVAECLDWVEAGCSNCGKEPEEDADGGRKPYPEGE